MSPAIRVPVGAAVFLGWMSLAFGPETASPSPADLEALSTPEGVALKAVALNDGPKLSMPTQIAIVGDRVVLVDGMAERPIHLLDRETGDLLTSLGRTGEGPGEFQWPRAVDPTGGHDGSFWVYDAALSRLTLVEPERWATESASSAVTVPVQAPAQTLGMVWTDGRILATGFYPDGRLGHFDESGLYEGATGAIPTSTVDAPPGVLQHAYRGTLKPDPSRERLVLATRHAGFIELYDSEGSSLGRIDGPLPFEPVFEVIAGERAPSMASGESLRFGYVDVAPTADRIYALFSGRTRASHPGEATYGDVVHVFDWDGTLVAELELDVDAFAIAVDEDRNRLLAVRHLPTPAVVSFDLPVRDG